MQILRPDARWQVCSTDDVIALAWSLYMRPMLGWSAEYSSIAQINDKAIRSGVIRVNIFTLIVCFRRITTTDEGVPFEADRQRLPW
jgi:hypothetical protein